jgi:shikimate dehydrogenase
MRRLCGARDKRVRLRLRFQTSSSSSENIMNVSGTTRLLGLLGWPVAHSLSPAMHNAAAAALGLDLVYVPLAVPPAVLPQAVSGLAALGFLGANVTVPHKESILPLLDEVAPAAAAIGAVNTVQVARAAAGATTLQGFNTDWQGFLEDLEAHAVEVAGRECILLGAGGSARAVAYALAHAGARIHLFARRPAQAEAVVSQLGAHFAAAALHAHAWDELTAFVARGSGPLIVNTTPVGMHPATQASPWPTGTPLPAGAFVYDLIYNPAQTRFLQQARAAGCRAVNGLGMLLRQGALAFTRWTGQEPDLAVMAQAMGTTLP